MVEKRTASTYYAQWNYNKNNKKKPAEMKFITVRVIEFQHICASLASQWC